MFSDSHCHLGDITHEAIEKAEESGFELLLTSGIDLISSEQAVKTARKYGIVRACIGIHPWYADEYSEGAKRLLRELAEDSEVVAVSEIGLDYVGRMTKDWVYEERIVDKAVQVVAFLEQLNLAKELDLPVLVHDRTPDQELLNVIEAEGNADVGAAIHGFSKGPEYARRCVQMGVYLSIGKRPLEAENEAFMDAIKQTPLEWLLTETDSDEPAGVLTVAEKIAKLKSLTRAELGKAATVNLKKLIGI